jgi:hypothetical protein
VALLNPDTRIGDGKRRLTDPLCSAVNSAESSTGRSGLGRHGVGPSEIVAVEEIKQLVDIFAAASPSAGTIAQMKR